MTADRPDAGRTAADVTSFSAATLSRLHECMLAGRLLDERCLDEFAHWYPGIGEEGVTVGAFASLRPRDFAVPHYRGSLGVFWLRGMSFEEIIAGILYRANSVTRGRLSGLHGGAVDKRILPYVTNVLGPNISTGAGLAMAEKVRGSDAAVVVAFGDGTAGLGVMHETLNMASIFALPAVFVCQNNQYSISTRSQGVHAWESVADWARTYGVPATSVDGNDVLAVHRAVSDGLARARAGEGTTVIDALTFRLGGHFSTDPARYQNVAERQTWEKRDPLKILERRLKTAEVLDEDEVTRRHEDMTAAIATAWEKAAAVPAVGLDALR